MDPSHYERFLAHLPIFRGLDGAEISEIVRTFQFENKPAGEPLCQEGDIGDCMYIVEKGRVSVMKKTAQGDRRVLAQIEGPTVVGEMSLLDGSPRSATVIATTPLAVYRIDRSAFDVLRKNWSSAAYKMIRNVATSLCERLRETNERIQDFYADPKAALAQMHERRQDLWKHRNARTHAE